jgi:endonuclease YncB( thermonuclease family)
MNCIKRFCRSLFWKQIDIEIVNPLPQGTKGNFQVVPPNEDHFHSIATTVAATETANEPAPLDIEMQTATYNNLRPFVPEISEGKIIRVYDGDTVTIAARFKIDGVYVPKLFRYNVRLRGIDSPEMKTKNSTEKSLALKSRDALTELIMDRMVRLENVEYDKYGRILANVITEGGINVSNWMIENGYAVEYDGGTKHRPAEWTDVQI